MHDPLVSHIQGLGLCVGMYHHSQLSFQTKRNELALTANSAFPVPWVFLNPPFLTTSRLASTMALKETLLHDPEKAREPSVCVHTSRTPLYPFPALLIT